MRIERATTGDAPEILELQRLAYVSEAEIYDDFQIQPMTQSLPEIINEMGMKTVIKCSCNGKIIGSVRAFMREDTCLVGKLMVHPDYQNKGVGSRLMNEIENMFHDAARFTLFTGHKSLRNLYLYNKLGYKEYKREKVNDELTHIFMEKRRNLTSG